MRCWHSTVRRPCSPPRVRPIPAASTVGLTRALPLADGSADLAIAFMSLRDVDDMPTAVAGLGRVLLPGGIACIALVHPLNSAGQLHGRDGRQPVRGRRQYLAEFPYTDRVSRDGLEMIFSSRHRPLDRYSRALESSVPSADASVSRTRRASSLMTSTPPLS
jgi:SAM-dependent methyltransferase